MITYVRLSLLIIMNIVLVNSLFATLCMEDSQCSSGLFCDTNAYSCIKCVSCEEHRQEPPAFYNQSTCLKSLAECGPCLKGFAKVYQEGSMSAKCMSPVQGYRGWSHLVIWLAAMITSVIVIGTFILVLRSTNVYKIHIKKATYYTRTLFLWGTAIPSNVPSLPPTNDFKTALFPNTVSTIGIVTPTKCLDVITELNTKKLGRFQIDSMTSLVVTCPKNDDRGWIKHKI